MSSFTSPEAIKLIYFGIPAQAEPIRLAFHIGGIPFDDVRVTGQQWQAMRLQYGNYTQIPLLEVDGRRIFQSVNILLYAGHLAGLIATDLEGELKMREIVLMAADLPLTFQGTFSITNTEERIHARSVLMKANGRTFCQLKRIEEYIGDEEYLVGNKLTVADLTVFTHASMLRCGHFDGFPRNCLDAFPRLKAFCDRIASLPKVREYYNKETGLWTCGFKPSEEAAACALTKDV